MQMFNITADPSEIHNIAVSNQDLGCGFDYGFMKGRSAKSDFIRKEYLVVICRVANVMCKTALTVRDWTPVFRRE